MFLLLSVLHSEQGLSGLSLHPTQVETYFDSSLPPCQNIHPKEGPRQNTSIIPSKLSFVYYTKKRHGVPNQLSTSEENKGLAKEKKIKMSPFYVEGERSEWQKRVT
jgi:hypothetical protein